jgi:hypothetical protein
VPFSHYPKIINNTVFAWVQPAPPDVPHREGYPDFLGRPFSQFNRFTKPIEPGTSVVGYHDAQPFTRFYGSAICDQPMEVTLVFSNDEVDAKGRIACDDNLGDLNYDALGLRQLYDPTKQEQTSKLFSMIFGRWLRIEIKNVGKVTPEILRCFIRGSVF